MNMTFRVLCIFHFLIVLLVVGCVVSEPGYDFDTQAKFADYETFSWLESTDEGSHLIQPVEDAIMSAVNQELDAKGLRLVDNSGDLLVVYYPGFKEKILVGNYGYEYWPARWGYGGYYGGADQYIYPKKMLILDLVDRRKSQLVWRGTAPAVIGGGVAEKQAEKIREAVPVILHNFPPPNRR